MKRVVFSICLIAVISACNDNDSDNDNDSTVDTTSTTDTTGAAASTDTDGIYHYYATDSYPYLQRCVKGAVETSGAMPPPPQ